MNFSHQIRLTLLALNILTPLYVHAMTDQPNFTMEQLYEKLRIVAEKLSDQKLCKEDKESISRSLEPEEMLLIGLALTLARSHERPVGILSDFMKAQDLLVKKMETLNSYVVTREQPVAPKGNPEDLVMPWERIVPANPL